MATTLKPGQVVMAKSGSPKMCIHKVEKDNHGESIICTYYNPVTGLFASARLPETTLKKVGK